MSIATQSNAKVKAAKIYLLESQNRQLINEVFDKLHAEGRMKYTSQSTSHDYFVFVVWRTISGSDESERKNRIVIDIRDFNKIVIIDFYFMSLQSDITIFVADCQYISVFDAADFFHQWLVKLADRHKLIVVSHRNQKQFNVAVMKFKNSSLYVQRKINSLLRAFRVFARVYVNDIVVFNHTLKKHLSHLNQIFQLFEFYDISLSFKKFFLDYFTVALLEQKMNAFEFIIVVDKLAAIIKLNFFYTLKNFEIYFDLIEWLRDFVLWYAQKTNFFQRRKTLLLKLISFNKNAIRKMYSKKTIVKNSTAKKLNSYRQLQKFFNLINFLIHFFADKKLYIDIDVFKRREFEAIIYHFKSICLNSNKFKRIDVEFIFFRNRTLNETKKKYWFIELEMADLV